MRELGMQDQCDIVSNRISKRMRTKKLVNAITCAVISVLGVLSLIYKVNYEGNFLVCLRELTVNGTIFTIVVSFCYFVTNVFEMIYDHEVEREFFYYLRLSSAVAEFVIALVVMIGQLPVVPDKPVIARFDMFNMHVLIPVLTILSFVFHDPSIGKLKPLSRWKGLIFVTLYALIIVPSILTGIIPQNKIPYSFLNFYTSNPFYILFSACFVFLGGYLISWMLSEWNRRASWLWYKNVARLQ